MRGLNDSILRAGLDVLYYSGIYQLMEPVTAGRGAIFALHRVRPGPGPESFVPNRGLEVTPGFLALVLARIRARGIDIVDLDEAARRLADPSAPRFASFTFDDGYADNLTFALPVFERFNAPFTIFVTTGFLDHDADFWWLLFEQTLATSSHVRTEISGQIFDLRTRDSSEKLQAWEAMYWPLRDLDVPTRRDFVAELAAKAGVEARALYAREAARWSDMKEAAAKGLLKIGAHTIRHPSLATLDEAAAKHEIEASRARLEREFSQEIHHFAYPFGDRGSAGQREFVLARAAGFTTALTMRRGPLFDAHAAHMHALPRISLNGNYQATKYLDLFLSGAPFVVWNRARRLDVA